MARHCRLLFVVLVLCLALPGAASASSVTPTFVPGNPSCADYGLTGLKIDRSNVAGDYSNGTLSVHIVQSHNGGPIASWSSNIGVDKAIVKGGAGGKGGVEGSNVYSYDPKATSDSDLTVPNGTALSHIEFCYGGPDSPPPTCDEQHAGEADMDGDGHVDACDNCPGVMNPGQEDSDHNGTGDACEPTPPQTCEEQHAGEADTDGDGVVDGCDNCPGVMNPGQEDSDHDDTGDACEGSPPPATCDEQHAGEADMDGDGDVDACDNCPTAANADQTDSDQDGMGDACEPTPPVDNTPPANVDQPQQQVAPDQQQAPADQQAPASGPAAPTDGQLVLGERVSAPTARLLAASGCAARSFSARVRGSQIARVVFKLDGKRIATLTKRNKAGLYAVRINPNKLKVGVHRLTVTVTFNATTRTHAKTLRASFQRCAKRLVAPRFTG